MSEERNAVRFRQAAALLPPHLRRPVERLDGTSQARAEELSREEGMVNIHPYADPYVAAGQGTIGLEIVADLPGAPPAGGASTDSGLPGG